MNLNEIINEKMIVCSVNGKTYKEVIRELVDVLYKNDKITNAESFYEEVLKRDEEISTVLENGVAIPHARTNIAKQLSLVVGIKKEGIDCKAIDGKPTQMFFLIASPDANDNSHIQALSAITGKILHADFRENMLKANSEKEIYNLLTKDEEKVTYRTNGEHFILGVTGCPTGVAHTYLAAKALEKAAIERNTEIKVETNGSIGVENEITATDIERAETIIVACDMKVDLNRFAGKKVIMTNTKEAVNNAESIIEHAIGGNVPVYQADVNKTIEKKEKKGLYSYLMNGVSYMIPFVITGGLLIAISLAIGGKPTPAGLQIPEGSLWMQINNVGVAAFTLMIPILAGFIGFAIGDRAALAPATVGGWIANNGSFYGADAGTGFIGAIVAGLLVGYLVKYMKKINWPEMIQPLVPIMIIPIFATLIIAFVFIFVIGAPIAGLMVALSDMLKSLSMGGIIGIGLVMGLMQGFDMGGPFGKVVFLFSVGLIASGETQFMGAQACAIPVAPIGMAIATFIGRKFFDEEEVANGKAALAMGLVGISEGAIPFAASDPLAVIPANMIGSAVACILGFTFGITDNVAHGGPIVALLGAINKPALALIAMLIGSIVTALICVSIKKYVSRKR